MMLKLLPSSSSSLLIISFFLSLTLLANAYNHHHHHHHHQQQQQHHLHHNSNSQHRYRTILQRGPLRHPHMLHPMSQFLGKPVRMDCHVPDGALTNNNYNNASSSKLRLVWMKDARLIRPDGYHHRVLSNGTLVIRHASLADAGNYHCLLVKADNDNNASSTMTSRQAGTLPMGLKRPIPAGRYLNSTRLKILTDELAGNNLVFKTKPPVTVSAHLGGNVEVICEAQLLTTPQQQFSPGQQILETWSRFNHAIESTGRVQLLDSGRLLAIQNVRPEDAGDYVCVAASTTGQVIAATTTILIVPKPPDDVTVTEGASTEFDCGRTPTSGDRNEEGVSSIEWTKDGNVIAELPATWRLSEDFTLLRILYAHPNDVGVFGCSVRNRDNEVIGEYRWRLTVKGGTKPELTLRPHDQLELPIGSTLVAECHATGSPAPLINWLRNGVDSSKGDNPLNNDPRVTISPETGRLEIRQLKPSDAGVYTCTAFNDLDEASAFMRVTVRQETTPPAVVVPAFLEGSPTVVKQASRADIDSISDNHLLEDHEQLSLEIIDGDGENFHHHHSPESPPPPPAPASHQILGHIGPNGHLEDKDVVHVVNKVRDEIVKAREETQRHLSDTNRQRTPQDLQAFMRQPDEQGVALSEASEIYERSLALIEDQLSSGHINYSPDAVGGSPSSTIGTHFLSPAHLSLIANLSGCLPHRQHAAIKCSASPSSTCYHAKYRTVDGTCNNLRNPTWGASHIPYARILSPRYENGIGEPVGWNPDKLYNGVKLPSARIVSTKLLRAPRPQLHKQYTHILMQWGQFLDHDFTFTPQTASAVAYGTNQRCNDTCSNIAPCFPIPVASNDHRIRKHKCIGITRSASTCGTGKTSLLMNYVYPREQINQITAFIDASNVYGSTEEVMNDLRDTDNSGYMLRVGPKSRHGDQHLLPFASNNEVDCQIDRSRASLPCFFAGDVRANEQLGLLAMHTIWMREHNFIASTLRDINPEWTPETIFQEARKIVGASMQYITYNDWLPKIIGPSGMQLLGPYKGYNDSVSPDIYNEFATAAFRFGHTLVMPKIFRFDENFQPIKSGHLPLREAFFAPYRLVDDEGGVDAIIRGLHAHSAKHFEPGSAINTELTDRLFALAHELALDLGGFNIQRGRDHALRSYTAYRKWCGFGEVSNFNDLRVDITNEQVLTTLQDLYGHLDNIDLYAGLVSEDPLENAIVGPTLQCILVDQFRRLRDGDRFWYEKPGVFTELQLYQIRQANLARVICDTGDNVTRVQLDVFRLTTSNADYVKCSQIPGIDLSYWRDCCFAEGQCMAKSEIEILHSLRQNFHRPGSDATLPQPRNLRLDPAMEMDESSFTTVTPKVSGNKYKTGGTKQRQKETIVDEKCSHDGTKEAIAELKAEIDILRREVAEFKARIRYRHHPQKVFDYSTNNHTLDPYQRQRTMHDVKRLKRFRAS